MDNFLGEIRPVPYNYAPQGWAFCNGQLLSIAQNTALFALVGTTFGGDGQTTFALPNLQSQIPLGAGQGPGLQNYTLGQVLGSEGVTLTINQIPSHTHTVGCSNAAATSAVPPGLVPALSAHHVYATPSNGTLAADSVPTAGSNQAHPNLQPYTVISYIIALQGIFPSRS